MCGVAERLPLDAMPLVIAAHEEDIALGVLSDAFAEQRIDVRIVHKVKTASGVKLYFSASILRSAALPLCCAERHSRSAQRPLLFLAARPPISGAAAEARKRDYRQVTDLPHSQAAQPHSRFN
jgi:hypothetical protein